MIRISESDNFLIIEADLGDLAPKHENQLSYWGFTQEDRPYNFKTVPEDLTESVRKICSYFERYDKKVQISHSILKKLEIFQENTANLHELKSQGRNLKEGILNEAESSEFKNFLDENIIRKLKDHQFKSALHLLTVQNGAIFSVPGSGKTSVVLAVFEMLRKKGLVDSLFVIGPPACFAPWREEYKEVIGRLPKYATLAGGSIEKRHSLYKTDINTVCDLYLTSFQTLLRDWKNIESLFKHQGIRFYLVVDEAHYIKQIDGSWAKAALRVSRFAKRRCILTGTPFPKSYTDSFNLFDFLWPDSPPISKSDKSKVSFFVKNNKFEQASELLDCLIGPLFYRVRKIELGLADQVFINPIKIPMNHNERLIYDTILNKVQISSQQDYLKDLNLVLRLRRGRMIRLRQCLSYTKLLITALDDYDEDLIGSDDTISGIIQKYDDIERPAKLISIIDIAKKLRNQGEKLVIWSNFVNTLKLIKNTLIKEGFPTHLIYGAIPFEKNKSITEELTREHIIKEFIDENSGIDILVANPAACAESISLHKTCSNAVYYDLSYNCAQYLQSLDRIHRVGGSEKKRSFYYFLQYENSIDQDILSNLNNKSERMNSIINQDYPIYSLDMFESDDDIDAYLKLFPNGSQSIQ
ncbi:MAG: DEAD/DEAH box helicase [Paracoccaceae bacterium]|nr:DEAD/DEAH box helicase [Paracoccaceae bacterium]MDE2673715.1 DEAD/DEAH box helicase [Paracoccaceae bacterium]